MARLIPPEISPGANVPVAERAILDALFRENDISKNWIVLHSLDIRWHINKLKGEIDFLVLAPGVGLLAVEVKGCNVTRVGGMWTYHYEKPKRTSEGPFRQASSAMYSLRDWLANKGATEISRSLKHSCAVFTEIDFSEKSPEWQPWEAIGRSNISAKGIVACLRDSLEAEHRDIAEKKRQRIQGAQWYDSVGSRPSVSDIETLLSRLRPDFSYEGQALANVERLEAAIHDATEEQTEAALGAMGNRRLLVKGAAGTGKTFIAIRLARMWAMEGKRVGLLCFNNLLGGWLSRELEQSNSAGGFAGTFSSLLLKLTSETVQDADSWRGLPQRALDEMLERNQSPIFDVLVVDEAQDLLKPEMVDVMDLLLEGGLKEGQWIFTGDFSRQAIFASGAGEDNLLKQLNRHGVQQAEFTLATNCRNAQRVATNVTLLGGLRPGYRDTLHSYLQGEVRPYFVDGATGKVNKLREILRILRTRFAPEQIVVLSSIADSTAKRLEQKDPASGLVPINRQGPATGYVGFCTIHAYKGLDAPAVVITDIDRWGSELDEALFYIGISRARQEAHLLFDSKLRAEYQRRVKNG